MICNYCGHVIHDDDLSASVSTTGRFPTGDTLVWSLECWTAHYHTSDGEGTSCFDRVHGAIELVEQAGPSLEAIPVATAAQIASLRPAYAAAELARSTSRVPAGRMCAPKLTDAEFHERINRASEPGGIYWSDLELGEAGVAICSALIRAGILTVAELEQRHRDGTLSSVRGIGARRLQAIDVALTERHARRPA